MDAASGDASSLGPGEQQATPSPSRSDAYTDLGLTIPIFVLYHLGVVLLPVRNAADPVTQELQELARGSLALYALATVAAGITVVLALYAIGERRSLSAGRFVAVGAEGAVYALLMRLVGGWALTALPLASPAVAAPVDGWFSSLVMSLGAGFYEEMLFRVGLFGVGSWVIRTMVDDGDGPTTWLLVAGWAVVEAAAFSGWHHIGPGADAFDMRVFVYRAICGVALTLVYAARGFAPAVWTHMLYDAWVMVL
ncbi:MAG: CPBP family glutamic-type intramembrane protease [Polyangiaceae bacterium]